MGGGTAVVLACLVRPQAERLHIARGPHARPLAAVAAWHPARLRDAASQIADVHHRLVLVILLRVGYAHKPVRRPRKQIALPFRGPGKVHGGYVIRVRRRVLSQWRGGMPWVPEIASRFGWARFYCTKLDAPVQD